MKNPLDNENFNKMFHITNNLCILVRKLDVDGKQRGYLEKIQVDIDSIFLKNLEEERNGNE